jgi:transcriptional regulator
MYVPSHFRMAGDQAPYDFMAAHAFATLVSTHEGAPFATHLPFLLEGGRLRAHMARANPQWKSFGTAEVMVVFTGPHAYVSPSWYEATDEVPTWNYAAVHAYGVPQIITDPTEVRAMLETLVTRNERGFAVPWKMTTASEAYLSRLMNGIVAFDIPIARLDAKEKLSQNHHEADRIRVAAQLARSDDPTDRELSALMTLRETTPSS